MRRITKTLIVTVLMVVLMVTMAVAPAFAKKSDTKPGNGYHGDWDRTHPSDPGCEGWHCT